MNASNVKGLTSVLTMQGARKKLAASEDFAAAVMEVCWTCQEAIDNGDLDLDDFVDCICEAGARSGFSRVDSTKHLKEALRAVRKGRGLNEDGSLKQDTSGINLSQSKSQSTASIKRLADVQAESVQWLWHPYIPIGKLTLLEGDPGQGKSFISCALATAVAAGRGLEGMALSEPGTVLFLSAEDGLADTLRPRLDSMGADVSRIFAFDEQISFDEKGLLTLDAAIIEYKPLLVIVDPLQSFLGASVDMHRANETRPLLDRLAAMAAREKCALLGIRHLSKGGTSKAIYRGMGTIDFTGSARSVLLAGEDPDTGQRAIIQIKCNLTAKGPSIGYELGKDGFRWTGQCDLTAERALNGRAEEDDDRGGRAEAKDFLTAFLHDGELSAKEVIRAAEDAGISSRTLKRAKADIGILSRKAGKKEWLWSLPEECQTDVEECHKNNPGTLQLNGAGKTSYVSELAEGCQP